MEIRSRSSKGRSAQVLGMIPNHVNMVGRLHAMINPIRMPLAECTYVQGIQLVRLLLRTSQAVCASVNPMPHFNLLE